MLAFLFLLCYIMQAWFVGQAVKTPPSHGGIRGSIPLRTANVMKGSIFMCFLFCFIGNFSNRQK